VSLESHCLLTQDLSLDQHVTAVSAKCFFSFNSCAASDALSTTTWPTLVQAFVASWVDYWGSLLIDAPKKTTDQLLSHCCGPNSLQRIKYDQGLSQFRRRELHCLDVDDRVRFRVCVQVYKCLHNMAHGYLCPAFLVVVTYELDFPRVKFGYDTRTGVCLRRSHILELEPEPSSCGTP